MATMLRVIILALPIWTLTAPLLSTEKHWAFRPLRARSPSPSTTSGANVIDRHIAAAREKAGLVPNAPASPDVLLRRMYYDVSGLPPTPGELAAFREAASADREAAITALVDRLLASPRFGERWGRHWLDVARYADSSGQEADQDRPGAFYYRDFVIRAINDDLPFDTFVRWQLAGDEIAPKNPSAVAATGFLTAGPNTKLEDSFLEEERLRNRYNELDDMLSTIGTGMLGLTLGCARCHDHKYDPIPSRDYYQMLSALHSGDRAEVSFDERGETATIATKSKSKSKSNKTEKREKPGANEKAKDRERPRALVFRDFGSERAETWLFERADFHDRDEPVELGFLTALTRERTAAEYWREARKSSNESLETTYQRRALANWITDVEHGAGALVARVIVNRIWHYHFGAGLVRTVNDFGARGELPSHPELLEWLARDLVDNGWRLKGLHRLILTSATYQQAATFDAARAEIDPENRLLWRMRPRRLEAEVLRDAMLAVSDTLNLTAFGPAFKPPIAAEAMVARNLKGPYPRDAKDAPATRRRSVYMFHKRVVPYPLLQVFDRPDALASCGRREETTVPTQALALLNDAFVRLRATEFADRLIVESGETSRQVARALALAFGRDPDEDEIAASIEFVAAQRERRGSRARGRDRESSDRLALVDFCQALFASNEFIYVD